MDIRLMSVQAETLDGLQERIVALDDLIAANSFRVRLDLEALWTGVMDLVVPPVPTPALSPVPAATATPSP